MDTQAACPSHMLVRVTCLSESQACPRRSQVDNSRARHGRVTAASRPRHGRVTACHGRVTAASRHVPCAEGRPRQEALPDPLPLRSAPSRPTPPIPPRPPHTRAHTQTAAAAGRRGQAGAQVACSAARPTGGRARQARRRGRGACTATDAVALSVRPSPISSHDAAPASLATALRHVAA